VSETVQLISLITLTCVVADVVDTDVITRRLSLLAFIHIYAPLRQLHTLMQRDRERENNYLPSNIQHHLLLVYRFLFGLIHSHEETDHIYVVTSIVFLICGTVCLLMLQILRVCESLIIQLLISICYSIAKYIIHDFIISVT